MSARMPDSFKTDLLNTKSRPAVNQSPAVNPVPLRHMRNGPDIDVALCGDRDMPVFVQSAKLITCPTCREKLAALVAKRSSRPNQMAARAVQLRSEPRDFRRATR